ncbi:MAG: eL32 family ribosomal protein [Candidatus Micrarchaeaceae archaeon]
MQKKSHPKFNIPNYGAKKRSRVLPRWRKQRGIDNKKRTKKSFMGAEPTIGYGNPKELKGVRPNGRRTTVVHNMGELERIAAHGEGQSKMDITMAKGISIRKRIAMTELAEKSGYKVTNGAYK